MIKVSNIQIPIGTTVILIQESKTVKVLFEYADNIFIGGLPDLSNVNNRVNITRILNFEVELVIPKNEILYGWQNSKAPFDSCKMLLISID